MSSADKHLFLINKIWIDVVSSYEDSLLESQLIIDEIIRAYSHPDRHYHNLHHLYEMITFVNEHISKVLNYNNIMLAILFHDLVYDSKAKDNEERSAEIAQQKLKRLDVSEPDISQIVSLIMATKSHVAAVPEVEDSKIFLDADLAILGSSPLRYEEYAKAIRKEYQWVSDEDYRKGRTNVLKQFLERESIYFYKSVYPDKESAARENMAQEVETLM